MDSTNNKQTSAIDRAGKKAIAASRAALNNWYKGLTPKTQKRLKIGGAIVGLCLVANMVTGYTKLNPKRTATKKTWTTATQGVPMVKLADHPEGFEIWKQGTCVYYKNVTDAALQNLGHSSRDEFKNSVMLNTTWRCAIFVDSNS